LDAESAVETHAAAGHVLRAAGFFSWGHDAWCHDEGGVGCVSTAEALELLITDERIADILHAKTGTAGR
jgi:hypothetical protein